MGGFFIAVNFRVNAFRKKILVYEWMKPFETALMCFISSSVFYWIPYLMTNANLDQACVPNSHQKLPPAEQKDHDHRYLRFWCGKDSYDPNSSYFFATEGVVIKNLIDRRIMFKPFNLLVFTTTWYFFMCITYGTNVPAGLFLPGVIVGCAMGDLIYVAAESVDIFES